MDKSELLLKYFTKRLAYLRGIPSLHMQDTVLFLLPSWNVHTEVQKRERSQLHLVKIISVEAGRL